MSRKSKKDKGDNLVFTKHAKERMVERNISTEEVKETIKNPDYTKNYGQEKISVKEQIRGMLCIRVKVMWSYENNQIIIKTACRDFYKKL